MGMIVSESASCGKPLAHAEIKDKYTRLVELLNYLIGTPYAGETDLRYVEKLDEFLQIIYSDM